MSSKPPVIWTEFFLEGDELDPNAFTQLVRVQPHRTGKKGDPSVNPTRLTKPSQNKRCREANTVPERSGSPLVWFSVDRKGG